MHEAGEVPVAERCDPLRGSVQVTQLIPYRNGERALAFQPDE
jgi:hypothetical protein